MFEFITATGSIIGFERINRRIIDAFTAQHNPPSPPTEDVAIFGNLTEPVPMYDDPIYQEKLREYVLRFKRDLIGLFRDKCEMVGLSLSDGFLIEEFKNDSRFDLFCDVLLAVESDCDAFLDECLYQSTVTIRGIQEAHERFKVTYYGQPINTAVLPGGYAMRAQVFEDRQAAIYGNTTWEKFCKLTGPEQSDYVAFYQAETTLALINKMTKASDQPPSIPKGEKEHG